MSPSDPSPWYQNAVFYELYLRAYGDSNDDGHGDLRGAMARLDHIQSLGVDCIWILPHYPSPLRDDGYDVADYTSIHPDYGDMADFKAFIDAVHARGMRLVIDLVMNHTSDQHPWFQAARLDRRSPYHDYYVWSDTGAEYSQARIIFLDYESSNWTFDPTAGRYFWHRFYSHQPDLNYDNTQVHAEMFRVIRFWLDMGIDGFRADAVPYLYEREGTNCENLPPTHDFLKQVRRLIDDEYPGRVLIAEANQWPADLLPYFGAGDEFHMCFHFPIMPRLFMALRRGDKRAIVDILAQTPPIPAGAQWLTFLRNHDELTLEMVTPEERAYMWQEYAPDPRMRSNLGIRRRLTPLVEHDPRRWRLLNRLLFSLPGAPIIYYGDEIGMGDNIALPDRHGCRTPMQWDSSPQAGFSRATQTYFPVNADYPTVNVAAQEADPDSYLNWTRRLVAGRRATPALQRGELSWVETDRPATLAYRRTLGTASVLCLYNLSAEAQPLTLDIQGLRDLAGEPTPTNTLLPYTALWLSA